MKSEKQKDEKKPEHAPRTRRPYQKPGFIDTAAFERLALACGGDINASPFQGCSLKS